MLKVHTFNTKYKLILLKCRRRKTMKKSIIAAGAASVALAAMPIVGVFAADGDLEQTDTVVVTVDSACSLATNNTSGDDFTATITNGNVNNAIAGSTFTITCNDTGGWDLNAVGAGTATDHVNYMDASTNVDGDDIITADGTPAASSSAWAFKLEKGGSDASNVTITTGYTAFKAIPANSTKVATGTSTAGNSTVTATYGVSIDATQSAGTYTGKVTYTLAHPASS